MSTLSSPSNLIKALNRLHRLSNSISSLYILVKRRLDTCKEYNISLIGNPIVRLETEVINLNYLVLQHIDVCKDFQNLKAAHIAFSERQKQIEKIQLVCDELKSDYKTLRSRSFVVPIRFVRGADYKEIQQAI